MIGEDHHIQVCELAVALYSLLGQLDILSVLAHTETCGEHIFIGEQTAKGVAHNTAAAAIVSHIHHKVLHALCFQFAELFAEHLP